MFEVGHGPSLRRPRATNSPMPPMVVFSELPSLPFTLKSSLRKMSIVDAGAQVTAAECSTGYRQRWPHHPTPRVNTHIVTHPGLLSLDSPEIEHRPPVLMRALQFAPTSTATKNGVVPVSTRTHTGSKRPYSAVVADRSGVSPRTESGLLSLETYRITLVYMGNARSIDEALP